ncbi:MAG: (Fe-S)-binding protein [Candidatus Thorarchaeota archaeon]|nr:MAG: (Fe-S)-binding protein [Candidatus Thorarchaeota archaeon]
MAWEENKHIIMECVSCGLCQSNCPIYKQTNLESNSAKGKMTILFALLQGMLEWDEVAERMYECTTCKNCEATCLSGLDIAAVIEAAREELVKRGYGHTVSGELAKNIRGTRNPFGEDPKERERLKRLAEA